MKNNNKRHQLDVLLLIKKFCILILFLAAIFLSFWLTDADTTVTAIVVGAGLAVAGLSFQGIFQNPMASPSLIGVPGAAYVGCVLAIGICSALDKWNINLMVTLSFIFGMAGMVLVFYLSSKAGRGKIYVVDMLLIGMVLGTMYQAIINFMVSNFLFSTLLLNQFIKTSLVMNPNNMAEASVSARIAGIPERYLMPYLISILVLYLIRWRLTALSFGDEEANALGVRVRWIKVIVILCATFITSITVAFCGMIGWVGLIIPHICRFIVGSDFRKTLPASIFSGAIFMMLVNDLWKQYFEAVSNVGAICAVIGAPVFFFIMAQGKRGWI